MNHADRDNLPRQERLNQILADYLRAAKFGKPPDRQELLDRHPDLAEELTASLVDHDKMMESTEPSQQALGQAGTSHWGVDKPTLPSGDVRLGQPEVEATTLPPPKAERDDMATLPLTKGSRTPTDAAPPPGSEVRYFGDYELLEVIARGGMGVVYKARQMSLNRIVALKMILAGQLAGQEDVKRFHTEAEAAANLDHPGIVPVFEVGEHEGQHYFSMGYVEGQSLAAKVAHGPLPPREAAGLTRQIAEAVAYAHEQGVIHRDLKPANVLLKESPGARVKSRKSPGSRVKSQEQEKGLSSGSGPSTLDSGLSSGSGPSTLDSGLSSGSGPWTLDSGTTRPMVTDFGLAKRVEGESDLTATGQILGTPSYMPPEQAAGKLDQINEVSDVYALGAILHTCLIGRPPFQADNPLETLIQVLEQEPVPPRQLNAKVPKDLDTICLKCLEKEPNRRYGSARELADDLDRYLRGEPIVAQPLGPVGRVNRWARRRPALAATVTALALFYTNHLISLYVLKSPGEAGAFHLFVTGLVVIWLLGAAMFQYLARKTHDGSMIVYGWVAMDVLLFTALLYVADGPKSTVLIGYVLLVAGAALRSRIGLVWFVTLLSIAGYLWLVLEAHWYRPQFVPASKAMLPFVLGLGVMGLMMHFLLRRGRRLDAVEATYEPRRDPAARGNSGRRLAFGRGTPPDRESSASKS